MNVDLFLHAFFYHLGECVILFPAGYWIVWLVRKRSSPWWQVPVMFFLSVLLTTIGNEAALAIEGEQRGTNMAIGLVISAIVVAVFKLRPAPRHQGAKE